MLQFARQDKTVRQSVDLAQLADAALRSVLVPPGIDVAMKCDIANLIVSLDRDQMTQVLANLITNACDAMPEGGALTLSIIEKNDRAGIRVSDTGTGISPANRSRIFTPFFTTKQIGKGTGLGLAVTYGIVKMHHGDISLESNTDPASGPFGTSFTITLPRTTPATTSKE